MTISHPYRLIRDPAGPDGSPPRAPSPLSPKPAGAAGSAAAADGPFLPVLRLWVLLFIPVPAGENGEIAVENGEIAVENSGKMSPHA